MRKPVQTYCLKCCLEKRLELLIFIRNDKKDKKNLVVKKKAYIFADEIKSGGGKSSHKE